MSLDFFFLFLERGGGHHSTFPQNTDCRKDQASEGIVFFGSGEWSLGGAIFEHSVCEPVTKTAVSHNCVVPWLFFLILYSPHLAPLVFLLPFFLAANFLAPKRSAFGQAEKDFGYFPG